ncbi:MAG: hypothetical protein ABJD68_10595 [Nakamurella sp.]
MVVDHGPVPLESIPSRATTYPVIDDPPVLVGGDQVRVALPPAVLVVAATPVGAVGTAGAATATEPPPSSNTKTSAVTSTVIGAERRLDM